MINAAHIHLHHTHTHKLRPRTVGRLLKAAESAATYQGMVPSDEVMSNNVRYYTNKYKLQPEDFTPREVGKLYCEFIACGGSSRRITAPSGYTVSMYVHVHVRRRMRKPV